MHVAALFRWVLVNTALIFFKKKKLLCGSFFFWGFYTLAAILPRFNVTCFFFLPPWMDGWCFGWLFVDTCSNDTQEIFPI